MRKPETALRNKIKEALQEEFPRALILKIHGSPYQEVGIPDLICCIKGLFIGLEVKMPGGETTVIQRVMLRRINAADGCAKLVTSSEEALSYVKSIIKL